MVQCSNQFDFLKLVYFFETGMFLIISIYSIKYQFIMKNKLYIILFSTP